jgi:3-hydroxyisobutyrate dehydrogenase
MSERIGYVGLGNLGVHLAMSLLKAGHEVVVTDLHRGAADRLVEAGARWVDSAAAVAAQATVIFTCLPSPAAVDAVLCGPGGILEGCAPGSTWIDNSTNDRAETLRLAARCADAGVEMLECPVTGGVHKAAEGDITLLVGGDQMVFERHRHLLEAMGQPLIYMGPLGNAAIIKVITNMLAFVNLVAVGEALMLAKQGGLDLATSFEAIRNSSGNSFVHETESQVILNGSYNIGFTMDLALKDLGFAMQMGNDFGVPLEVAGLVEQTFLRAKESYGGAAWSSQVVKLLEDSVGSDLRAAGFPATLQ